MRTLPARGAMFPANTKKHAKVASRPQSTATSARRCEGGERRGHDDDGSGDGHDAEHGQQGEGEQQPVGDKAPSAEGHGRGELARIASAATAVRVAAQPPGASDDADSRQREGQRHRAQEIAEVQPIVRVQIQVLAGCRRA